MSKRPPLGYLIKSVDNALHRYVDGVLREAHGIGRATGRRCAPHTMTPT